jgi:hypothetical protein
VGSRLRIKIPDIKVIPKGEGGGKFLKFGGDLPPRDEKYFDIRVDGKDSIPVFIREIDEPGPLLDGAKREIIFPYKAVKNYIFLPPTNRPLVMIAGPDNESKDRYSRIFELEISKLITHYILLAKLGRMHIVSIHEALHSELLLYELGQERNLVEDMFMPFLIYRIYKGKRGYHSYNEFKVFYDPLVFAFIEMFRPNKRTVAIFPILAFFPEKGSPKFNNSKAIMKPSKIMPLKTLRAPLVCAWAAFEKMHPDLAKRFFEFTSPNFKSFHAIKFGSDTTEKVNEIINQQPFNFSILLDGWLKENEHKQRNEAFLALHNHCFEIGPKIERGEEFEFNLELVTALKHPELFS